MNNGLSDSGYSGARSTPEMLCQPKVLVAHSEYL